MSVTLIVKKKDEKENIEIDVWLSQSNVASTEPWRPGLWEIEHKIVSIA